MAIIIAALVVAVVVAFALLILFGDTFKNQESDAVRVTATADLVHMERSITAAGKVTAGENETISLDKGKTLKAVAVAKKEGVKEGQPLVYYTDGTHTDAPSDGIVSTIHTPDNGKSITDSHSIGFSDTRELYLKVTVPEDEINNVKKGDAAQIVVNAKPHETFHGVIIDKKDVSTTMINKIRSESDSSSSDEESISDDIDDDDYTDDSDGEDDEDFLDEEEDPGSESGDNSVVYYSVNIKFSNDGTVLPGMSANCEITVSNRDDVLAVPVESVYFDDRGKAFVYKEDSKSGEKNYIETGSSDADNVEIISGLEKGDRIIYDKN